MTSPEPHEAAGTPLSATDLAVDLAALSHPGKVRPANEDHYLLLRFGRYLEPVATNLPEGSLPGHMREDAVALLVADGMGGRQGGGEASRQAIVTVIELVLASPMWIFRLDERTAELAEQRTAERLRQASAAIAERAARDPRLAGMGTTMTVAVSFGQDLIVVYVGDSRAYVFRDRRLEPLTRDHTMAQDFLDGGVDSGMARRFRHVLTHALGGRSFEPEVRRWRLAPGDRLLLCTDGLNDMVDDAAIAAELERHSSSAAACQALVDRALEQGGRDNVTVALAGYRAAP
jgi:protein phosphatase